MKSHRPLYPLSTCLLYTSLKKNLSEALQDLLIRDDGRDQTLLDILPAENILLNYPAENWRDAIRTAGGLLVVNGYVDQRYPVSYTHLDVYKRQA